VGNNEERARKNENFGTKKMKFLGLINREPAIHSSNPSTVRKIPHLLEKIQHKNTAFAVIIQHFQKNTTYITSFLACRKPLIRRGTSPLKNHPVHA